MDKGTYAVVTAEGTLTRGQRAQAERGGLSHADAMILAEGLRDRGLIATIVHVVGGRWHEVDRYPAR